MQTGTTKPPSSRQSSQREGIARIDPLVHVCFALLACGLSLAIAYFTFASDGPFARFEAPLVHAAPGEGTRVAIETQTAEQRQAFDRFVLASAKSSELPVPPTLADEEQLDGLLRCSVVDESWAPVTRAEIWLNQDGNWRLAGRSDANGLLLLRYRIKRWEERLRAGEPVQLGARGSIHGPSLVSDIAGEIPKELRLILRGRAASLRLEVTNPSGQPVAGAFVSFEEFGSSHHDNPLTVLVAPGEHRQPTPAPSAQTDQWGSITFDGLEAGTRRFTIEAEGYRRRPMSLEIAPGEARLLRVKLAPLAQLQGQVIGANGRPAAGALVSATGGPGGQVHSVHCDESGRYALSEIPAGTLELIAELRQEGFATHDARATLFLSAGESGQWSPILQPVSVLSGRLLDHWGQPLAGWRVALEEEGDEATPLRYAMTDESGQYNLVVQESFATQRLSFFHPYAPEGIPTQRIALLDQDREPILDDVELEEGDESASAIRGRVVGANGRPLGDHPILLQRLSDQATYRFDPDPDTGLFETPALPPGAYILRFPRVGHGWALDQRLVVDGGRPLDVGTIELPETGQVRFLTASDNRREACVQMHVELMRSGVANGFGLPVMLGRIELPIQLEFAPGDYRLRLPEAGGRRWIDFNVSSEGATQIIVPGTE